MGTAHMMLLVTLRAVTLRYFRQSSSCSCWGSEFGNGHVLAMRVLYIWQCIKKTFEHSNFELIWQVDVRQMSGDIVDLTTIAAVKLGKRVRTMLT